MLETSNCTQIFAAPQATIKETPGNEELWPTFNKRAELKVDGNPLTAWFPLSNTSVT